MPPETRKYGETDGDLLLCPGAEVVLGKAVRWCWPTEALCDSYKPRAADPSPRTRHGAPRRCERNSGASIAVPNLVPMHDRGPRAPRRRSPWLLLPPRSERARRRLGTTAFALALPVLA